MKVKRVTPLVGQVTILFVRDDDDNIIPSGSEVTTVKDAILERKMELDQVANQLVENKEIINLKNSDNGATDSTTE